MMLSLEQKHPNQSYKVVCCDNHIIANSISVELAKFFIDSGFSEQTVVGGDSRVRMKRLWSKKSSTVEEGDEWFKKCQYYIQQDNSFVGYIEEEAITFDEPIAILDLNELPWASLLPKLNPSPCPEGIYKASDIHLSLHKVNPKVERRLFESGFYYLELYKPKLGNVRVYTMQTQNKKEGGEIFQILKKILIQGGGVEGFLKFELTRNLYNQGFSLPPIILS